MLSAVVVITEESEFCCVLYWIQIFSIGGYSSGNWIILFFLKSKLYSLLIIRIDTADLLENLTGFNSWFVAAL